MGDNTQTEGYVLEKFGGRKFLLSVLVLLLSFALVLTGHLVVDVFISLAEMITGIYVVGNVANKLVSK